MAEFASHHIHTASNRPGWNRLLAYVPSALMAEQDRWVLWLPVFMGGGICIYFALGNEPPAWAGAAFLMSCASVAWIIRHQAGWRMAGLLVLALGVGLCAAQARTLIKDTSFLVKPLRSTMVRGMVLDVERFPDSQRVLIEVADMTPPPRITTRGRLETVRLRLRGDQPQLQPGQRISVRAGLLPPPGPAAPGAFDFQRKAYFDEIGAVGYGRGRADILPPPKVLSTGMRIKIWWTRVRLGLADRIRASIPGEAGAVAAALITGDRSTISEETLQEIRNAGLAHLLAISGLHVGLVAGIIFFWVRASLALWTGAALRYPVKKWAAGAAIAGAFLYTLLAGATVPTQRAFIMISLVFIAVMADRRGISLRSVGWAALVVMVLQPESLLGPSFQMSFSAVVALIAAYEALSDYGGDWARLRDRRLLKRGALYLTGIAFSTLIAGAATGLFAAFHFNVVAAFSLVANIIAVPLTALWIMPWAVLGVAVLPLGLEGPAFAMMGWGIEALLGWAETVSTWDGSVVRMPSIPVWGAVSAAFGGLWLCLWRRPWRLLGLFGVAVCALSLWFNDSPDILMDGQARVVALKTQEGGYVFSTRRAGRRSAQTWLRRAGVRPDIQSWRRRGSRKIDIRCDGVGCRATIKGKTIAIIFHPAALQEDCRHAHIVLSRIPIRGRCDADIAIGRFDVWRNGAYALWMGAAGEVSVKSVNGSRGARPWVIRPAAYRKRSNE